MKLILILVSIFASLANPAFAESKPAIICQGFLEVVDGGLSEHTEYKLPGAELRIYKKLNDTFSAEVISPTHGLEAGQPAVVRKTFPNIKRTVQEAGGGSPKEVLYSVQEGENELLLYTVSTLDRVFTANLSAQMQKIGWSNFALDCEGTL